MNTFSASPEMMRSLAKARYVVNEPAQQTQARAIIRAQQRQARRTWNPFSALARWLAVPTPTGTPAHSR